MPVGSCRSLSARMGVTGSHVPVRGKSGWPRGPPHLPAKKAAVERREKVAGAALLRPGPDPGSEQARTRASLGSTLHLSAPRRGEARRSKVFSRPTRGRRSPWDGSPARPGRRRASSAARTPPRHIETERAALRTERIGGPLRGRAVRSGERSSRALSNLRSGGGPRGRCWRSTQVAGKSRRKEAGFGRHRREPSRSIFRPGRSPATPSCVGRQGASSIGLPQMRTRRRQRQHPNACR